MSYTQVPSERELHSCEWQDWTTRTKSVKLRERIWMGILKNLIVWEPPQSKNLLRRGSSPPIHPRTHAGGLLVSCLALLAFEKFILARRVAPKLLIRADERNGDTFGRKPPGPSPNTPFLLWKVDGENPVS